MKKLFAAIFFFSLFSCFSQTIIPGGVINGNWSLSGSPYIVQGAIMVANGNTLTIEPGVKVEFQGNYKILVLGRLLAIGTPTDSITFTAADTTNGWFGIRFDHTAATNDTSKFYYCNFEYGKTNDMTNEVDYTGGAICFNYFSKAVISNSLFTHCSSIFRGGAIGMIWSNAIIKNNLIKNNRTTAGNGGAIFSEGGTIINNVISNNYANGQGGAIYCGFSTITNNTFLNNITTYDGGGINNPGGAPLITNNTFFSNSALNGYGGALICEGSNATIENNFVYNNIADNGGGFSIKNCNPTLNNNIISNNTATYNGGGMNVGISCSPTIKNHTISNNSAQKGGGLFCSASVNPKINSCILWNNSTNQVYINDDSSDPDFYFCDIQNGQAGIVLNSNVFYFGAYLNNINSDPLFINPSAGVGSSFNSINSQWSLLPSSPCINSGDTSVTSVLFDIIGNPRVSFGRIDIGAYESTSISILENNFNSSLEIYPNPANDYLCIKHETINTDVTYQIYDIIGKSMEINTIFGNKMDVSLLPSGIYFLHIKQSNSFTSKKIIIQH